MAARVDEGSFPSNSEPVQVIVRIRPEPGSSTSPVVVARDGRSVALLPPPVPPPDPTGKAKPSVDTKIFSFDKVFSPQAAQDEVYQFARPLVLSAVDGYNSTIFAYGHTGSGKTHTMMGTPSQPGMTPRAVQEMFALIRHMSAREPDTIFIVRVSYVELYNNRFRNLLEGVGGYAGGSVGGDGLGSRSVGFGGSSVGTGRGSWRESAGDCETSSLRSSWRSMTSDLGSSCGGRGGGNLSSRSCEGGLAAIAARQRREAAAASIAAGRNGKIEVRECPERGVFLSGPGLRRAVTSPEEVLRLVARGDAARATGATDCNEHSSRSHAILSFHVESQRVSSDAEALAGARVDGPAKGRVRLGKLHLVDLAGSERLSLSGSEGKRLHETQNINLSLSSLGNVLACLSRNATIAARRSARARDGGGGGDVSGVGEAPAPVPYRDSKLTHFLKDSLGGNSKTVMVTTLRSTPMYHRQSLISLMYASRAKKIRNQSSVNVDTAGQSNIHQVSAEIETLRHRLDQRSLELNRLHNANLSGQAENAALRDKLQGLSSINERERAQLEGKLSTVIHSQAGKLAVQHQAFVSLQDRLQRQLGEYQKKCMLQQKEITHLRSTIETMERETGDRVGGQEVQEMQRAVEAWQAQATKAHQELRHATTELETTRKDSLARKTAADSLVTQLTAAEARERALLGYWRQLQAALDMGTDSPMSAETIIGAINRLKEVKDREASARVRAEKARAAAERAARDISGGARECKELDDRVSALAVERDSKWKTLKGLVDANEEATKRLEKARAERAQLEASIVREEARTKAAGERLSKTEENLGRALEAEGLRFAVDEAQAAREAARAEAAKARIEMRELMASREEAGRSNEALRERLEEFERTLRGANEEARAMLDERDAALQRAGFEREQEREAHKTEVEELRRSVADTRGIASRFKAELARAKTAASQHKEQAGAAATSAASAAASESAAKARVAVAIGARQDAEKKALALRESLLERDREVASVKQELAKATSAIEKLRRELDQSRASETESRRQAASAVAAAAAKASTEAGVEAAARLRNVEQAAAQAREKSTRELHEYQEECAALQRRAEAAEVKARELVSRGRAELAELTHQRDEAKRFLQKSWEEHEAALAAERRRAQDSLHQAVEAAVRNRDRESEQALSTLSAGKDRALHRALEAKELEMRRALDDAVADAVAKAVVEASERERRAVNDAVAAEAERGRKAREEAARVLEERTRDVEKGLGERALAERDEAITRAVAEEGRHRARELEGVVARGEEETRRAVQAAEARKDREMSKALKAAGRLALKGKREAQAALEAERLRLSQEQSERLRNLEKTHREEIESMRERADKAIRETEGVASARSAADRAAAMDEAQRVERVAAEAKAVADQKISGLEEELEGLRRRLDELPGKLRAKLEREFDERERHAREEVRDEMRAQFDTEMRQKETDARAELEERIARAEEEIKTSHEVVVREALARSEERCRVVEESAVGEERRASLLELELRAHITQLEESCREARAAVEARDRRHRQELKESLELLAAEHRVAMEEAVTRTERDREEAVATARATVLEESAVDKRAAVAREAEARDCTHKEELEEACGSLSAEHRVAMAAVVARAERDRDEALAERAVAEAQEADVRDRRNKQELEEALESLATEHRVAMEAIVVRAKRDQEEAVAAARATVLEEATVDRRSAEARAAEARGRIHKQELEEVLESLAAQHRVAIAAAVAKVERDRDEALAERQAAGARVVEARDRRHKQELEGALESLAAGHRAAMEAAAAKAEKHQQEAIATVLEEAAAERRAIKARAAEAKDFRHRQELEEALESLAAEHRVSMAAAVARVERDRDEAMAERKVAEACEAEARDRRYKQELEEALESLVDEHRRAMATVVAKAERDRDKAVAISRATILDEVAVERREAETRAVEARDRRHKQELEEALESRAAEHRAAIAAVVTKAERDRDEALAERQATEVREFEARDRRHRQELEEARNQLEKAKRRAREEQERRKGREAEDASQLREEVAGAVKAAIEDERRRLEKRHAEELERVARAGALATRVATETSARKEDDRVAALERRVQEEAERRRAAEAAMEQAAKKWGLERATVLEEKNREHREAVQAALASLSSDKDAALEAAVVSERRRANSAEERATSAEARAAEAEEARMTAAMEIAAAQAEGRARSQGGDEQRRRFQEEAERLRAREEGIVRAREEAEMLSEEEKSRVSEEIGRLRDHATSLMDSLRAARDATTAETERARAAAAEAESLRREAALLADETVAIRENASRREQQLREGLAEAERKVRVAEAEEIAAREEASAAAKKAEQSARDMREEVERRNAESLVRALEEMERQQSGVLSAALARSDAALKEVARVKEAMWNKAEENADALREAFEEAAERAAEEAEQATADALAKAEGDFQEKLAKVMEARDASTAKDVPGEIAISQIRHDKSLATLDEQSDARISRGEHEEALRGALDSQRVEHERRLEAALAERDAEALEALRLLNAQHLDAASKNGFIPSFTGSGGSCSLEVSSVDDERRKRDRRQRRPRPSNNPTRAAKEEGLPQNSTLTPVPGSKGRRSRSMTNASSTEKSPVTLSVAVAERDAALLEVKEVSDRLGEALCSVGTSERLSTPSSSSSSSTSTRRRIASDAVSPPSTVAGGVGVDNSDNVGGMSRRVGVVGDSGNHANRNGASDAKAGYAPAWAVGRSPPAAGSATAEPDMRTARGKDSGLTLTEKRYKRELKTLQVRVQEVEGMMGERLEERERLYRRKLRAAVSECRTLRVREQGAAAEAAAAVGQHGGSPSSVQEA